MNPNSATQCDRQTARQTSGLSVKKSGKQAASSWLFNIILARKADKMRRQFVYWRWLCRFRCPRCCCCCCCCRQTCHKLRAANKSPKIFQLHSAPGVGFAGRFAFAAEALPTPPAYVPVLPLAVGSLQCFNRKRLIVCVGLVVCSSVCRPARLCVFCSFCYFDFGLTLWLLHWKTRIVCDIIRLDGPAVNCANSFVKCPTKVVNHRWILMPHCLLMDWRIMAYRSSLTLFILKLIDFWEKDGYKIY